MKVVKNFTLDYELSGLLAKERNASELINELLHNYYDQTAENLAEKIREMKQKAREIKQNMRVLKQKQREKEQKQAHMLELIRRYGSTKYRRVRFEDPEMEALAKELDGGKKDV